MAGKPKNFQAISNVLANYNFVDIAAGTGYINFYAGQTADLSLLSNFAYYSDPVKYTANVGGVNTLVADIDFDAVLNRPLDISGIGIVNIPVLTSAVGDSIYAIVYLRKWNGVVETDLVTNTSDTYTVSVGLSGYYMLGVDLSIPLTHFKIGETLRLTIMFYSGTAAVSVKGFAFDPKNRSALWDTTGAVPSQLVFQCPVRLNL